MAEEQKRATAAAEYEADFGGIELQQPEPYTPSRPSEGDLRATEDIARRQAETDKRNATRKANAEKAAAEAAEAAHSAKEAEFTVRFLEAQLERAYKDGRGGEAAYLLRLIDNAKKAANLPEEAYQSQGDIPTTPEPETSNTEPSRELNNGEMNYEFSSTSLAEDIANNPLAVDKEFELADEKEWPDIIEKVNTLSFAIRDAYEGVPSNSGFQFLANFAKEAELAYYEELAKYKRENDGEQPPDGHALSSRTGFMAKYVLRKLNAELRKYRIDRTQLEISRGGPIKSFRGRYDFLSNMYDDPVTYQGRTYRNAEAAFQAQKDPSRASEFENLSGKEAKALGKKVELREDWSSVRIEIMREILEAKFSDQYLMESLMETGASELIEGNTWGDKFWGVSNGEGANNLGKLLMEIRDSNRESTGNTSNSLLTNQQEQGTITGEDTQRGGGSVPTAADISSAQPKSPKGNKPARKPLRPAIPRRWDKLYDYQRSAIKSVIAAALGRGKNALAGDYKVKDENALYRKIYEDYRSGRDALKKWESNFDDVDALFNELYIAATRSKRETSVPKAVDFLAAGKDATWSDVYKKANALAYSTSHSQQEHHAGQVEKDGYTEKDGNLLEENGVICHQVNCRGKMGAGLANDIKKKFPSHYSDYTKSSMRLGDIVITEIVPGKKYVVGLFGQDGYGRDKQYTDYDALRSSLEKANAFAKEKGLELKLPHGLGSGLAGGDWNIVSKIIGETVDNAVVVNNRIQDTAKDLVNKYSEEAEEEFFKQREKYNSKHGSVPPSGHILADKERFIISHIMMRLQQQLDKQAPRQDKVYGYDEELRRDINNIKEHDDMSAEQKAEILNDMCLGEDGVVRDENGEETRWSVADDRVTKEVFRNGKWVDADYSQAEKVYFDDLRFDDKKDIAGRYIPEETFGYGKPKKRDGGKVAKQEAYKKRLTDIKLSTDNGKALAIKMVRNGETLEAIRAQTSLEVDPEKGTLTDPETGEVLAQTKPWNHDELMANSSKPTREIPNTSYEPVVEPPKRAVVNEASEDDALLMESGVNNRDFELPMSTDRYKTDLKNNGENGEKYEPPKGRLFADEAPKLNNYDNGEYRDEDFRYGPQEEERLSAVYNAGGGSWTYGTQKGEENVRIRGDSALRGRGTVNGMGSQTEANGEAERGRVSGGNERTVLSDREVARPAGGERLAVGGVPADIDGGQQTKEEVHRTPPERTEVDESILQGKIGDIERKGATRVTKPNAEQLHVQKTGERWGVATAGWWERGNKGQGTFTLDRCPQAGVFRFTDADGNTDIEMVGYHDNTHNLLSQFRLGLRTDERITDPEKQLNPVTLIQNIFTRAGFNASQAADVYTLDAAHANRYSKNLFHKPYSKLSIEEKSDIDSRLAEELVCDLVAWNDRLIRIPKVINTFAGKEESLVQAARDTLIELGVLPEDAFDDEFDFD